MQQLNAMIIRCGSIPNVPWRPCWHLFFPATKTCVARNLRWPLVSNREVGSRRWYSCCWRASVNKFLFLICANPSSFGKVLCVCVWILKSHLNGIFDCILCSAYANPVHVLLTAVKRRFEKRKMAIFNQRSEMASFPLYMVLFPPSAHLSADELTVLPS